MDNKTAKQVVNEALNMAIAKGCFGLIEVTNIVKALEFLNGLKANSPEEKLSLVQSKASFLTRSNRHQEAFQLMQNEASNFPHSPEFKFDYAEIIPPPKQISPSYKTAD